MTWRRISASGVEDGYQDTYRDASTDGSVFESCMAKFHNACVMRCGGWNPIPAWLCSTLRDVGIHQPEPKALDFVSREPTERVSELARHRLDHCVRGKLGARR